MKFFEQKYFYELVTQLYEAESPSDVTNAWLRLQGRFSELSAVIHLEHYKQTVLPSSIRKYTREPLDHLVPYFMSETLYFIDNNMLVEIIKKGEKKFHVDYSVMLDTNMASYIRKLIRGESLETVQDKLLPLVDEMLRDDLNFDFLFYLIENIKELPSCANQGNKRKLDFWMSLKREFRENLCGLQMFSSIDCKEYNKTLKVKYNYSYRQSVKNSVELAYMFYVVQRDMIDDFVLHQRVWLLNLIGMVRIQEESNRNARNKMKSYIKFMHETVGVYLDREAVIAFKYFVSRENLPILRKIQKRCKSKGILKKLDNIAWDMAVPRLMEMLISSKLGGSGGYFVPLFLTFDNNLKKMLGLYPIKGAIYNRETGDIISLPKVNSAEYFRMHKLEEDINWIRSDELKAERRARGSHTRTTVHKAIQTEYRKLLAVLKPRR